MHKMDFGVSNIKAPRLVATPLPPRNLSQTGKRWPTTAKNAATGHDELLMRPAEEHARHENRRQAFGGVEQQGRNAERR